MPENIDYEALYQQVIAENEQLRERLSKIALKSLNFDKQVIKDFFNLTWEERYFAIAAICAILVMLSALVRDVRRGNV